MTSRYYIKPADNLLKHFVEPTLLVHDAASNNEVDALVASGDYFVALASSLDALQAMLSKTDAGEQPELERVIRSLFYLQRHYTVTKNTSSYRS